MLKPLLFVLLAANVGVALWGYVASARTPQLRLGGDGTLAPTGSEPQWSERIVLVPLPDATPTPAPASNRPAPAPVEPAAPLAAAPTAIACLEAGPYAETARATVDGRVAALGLSGLEGLRWTRRESAGWWVAMGPFTEAAQRAKQAELRRLGVNAEMQTNAAGRWLVLARSADAAGAEAQLQALRPRGIRTARSMEAGQGAGWMLQLPQATPVQRQALLDARLPGPGFRACAAGA